MELVAISPKQEFPTQMNINLHSPKRDEWFGILAIIDSGTEENWIAEKIVQDYNLRDEAGMPICCTDFGGGHIESDRCVKLTWRKERAKKTERAYFHVGKDAPFDVLFGSNIMNAAPALFRDNSTEPALVLVQNRISVRHPFSYDATCHPVLIQNQHRVSREQPLNRTEQNTKQDLELHRRG